MKKSSIISFLTKKVRKKSIYIYIENDSSGKVRDPGNFSKSQFVIFRSQKYKKGYIEMTKKNYLETLQSV